MCNPKTRRLIEQRLAIITSLDIMLLAVLIFCFRSLANNIGAELFASGGLLTCLPVIVYIAANFGRKTNLFILKYVCS